MKRKTGGGAGTNQYAVKGITNAYRGRKRISGLKRRECLLASSTCPVPLLEVLAADAQRSEIMSIIRHPNCTKDILLGLERWYSREVVDAIIDNPQCDIEVLDKIYKVSAESIRFDIVRHPQCPMSVFRAAVQCKNVGVLITLVNAGTVPPALYETLVNTWSGDRDLNVLRIIIASPQCSADALRKMYRRYPGDLDDVLAAHPNSPGDMLEELIRVGNEKIRVQALAHANCPLYLQAMQVLSM